MVLAFQEVSEAALHMVMVDQLARVMIAELIKAVVWGLVAYVVIRLTQR